MLMPAAQAISSFVMLCNTLQVLHTHCKHSPVFDSLAEAEIKVQQREQVRTAPCDRYALRAHSPPRLAFPTTIISWGSYGAAME
jgi:hypothetical protein